jgi:hypothetical protein
MPGRCDQRSRPRRCHAARTLPIMAEWDETTIDEELQAWRAAIRKAVRALPPEHRTDGASVVKLLLGQS